MNSPSADQISRKTVWGSTWVAPALFLMFFVGLAVVPTLTSAQPRKSEKKKPGVPGVQLPLEFTDFLRRGL
jgi:hypothetical protein